MSAFRRVAVVMVGVVILVALPTAAGAGGWWSGLDLDKSYIAPGQSLKARTDFLFATVEAAERARSSGTFYAYLLHDLQFDAYEIRARNYSKITRKYHQMWTVDGARAIRLGAIELNRWNANLAHASGTFRMPEVPPGEYSLMFCSLGCTKPVGDIVSTPLTVVKDPVTAHHARRLEKLETQVGEHRGRIARSRARNASDELVQKTRLDEMEGSIHSLARRLAAAEDEPTSPWVLSFGWFAFGGIVAALAGRALHKRLSSRPGPEATDWDPTEELERELVGSDR